MELFDLFKFTVRFISAFSMSASIVGEIAVDGSHQPKGKGTDVVFVDKTGLC